jgi:sulfopropanediol 3-dehydrogenase
MKIIKEGGHRLFEKDQETAQYVSKMLLDLETRGMDAVLEYSEKFDNWNPDSFELSQAEIDAAVAICDPTLIADTDYCQDNVRAFAEAQLATLQPLEMEIRPGVILGHRHIPVESVGIDIPAQEGHEGIDHDKFRTDFVDNRLDKMYVIRDDYGALGTA